MQAVTIREFGDPSGMAVRDLPAPTPAAGQVAIRTEAIAAAGVDAMIRRGMLGPDVPAGLIPGSEVAGVVTSVGSGTDPSWTGRRVWAFTGTSGGYAERAVAHVDDLVPIPDALSSIDAVTLGSAGTVAHFALAHAHFTAGERVLIRGAAGSIGIAAVELAAQGGAGAVAVTTSSAKRGQRLQEFGATHILDRSGSGGANSPSDFDVVIDIVGGADVPVFLDRLAPNGRMILVGAVAGYPPENFGMSLIRAFQRSRSFATFSLATVPTPERNSVRAAQFEAAVRGDLHTVVHDVLLLDRAAEAHQHMDDGTVFGRIVLVPSSIG